MPIKKDIIYPIFLECCELIEDTFWKNIFEDLAYSKCPYGTFINKDFFCCNYKNKEFSYKIEQKDPEQLYKDIYDLLVKKLGLLSHKDKIKKKIDFTLLENEIKENRKNWSSIRKKNIKDNLIENYVIEMKTKYDLTIKQARNLISVIYIGLIFKVFTVKDILYENAKIEKIDGISFKKNEIILEKDIYKFQYTPQSFIFIEKKLMSDTWEKFLDSLRKLN